MRINTWFLFFFSLFLSLQASAQTLDELESEKKQLNQRIKNANALLVTYNKQKRTSLKNVNLLSLQIKDRERLIALYEEEIALLETDIKTIEIEISTTQDKLEQLKQQYAKLISETYNNKKRYNELSFFFGAESFNEAYRRFVMLKEYNRFRHNQGLLIEKNAEQLDNSYQLLNTKLKVQNNALNSVKSQHKKLLNDKQSVNRNIQDLKRKESSVKQELRKQKRALKKLEDAIVKVIAEMTKESVEPSDFHLSKGKLLWPVKQGIVVSQFGEHQHPVLKYVKVNNNGIDIQSTSDNVAKSVFSGKVSRIVPIPGYNKAVLVRHGRFLTVYANIENVHVKPGQNVTKNMNIGTIYSGKGENSGVLHFEIWEESVKLNPELWLLK
ncbi:peptidoglycan DD-metalloendopeptidase family protein [Carboxylicivirga sp. A043]|uniref:murein hydrolase activator EnvC family protein n=1 Tax=Carboxylicivirga litoralis TaxID=2816963 RepID=UPI0021CB484A|nr:peptidoglycan DD-metalloendopeptidase family protein [Carboxylicivirga sp. A043]MCU4156617.1 peptidoglycan DD-metalloendopeptidase family protein [Carboxylicivirga sp. A043]